METTTFLLQLLPTIAIAVFVSLAINYRGREF